MAQKHILKAEFHIPSKNDQKIKTDKVLNSYRLFSYNEEINQEHFTRYKRRLFLKKKIAVICFSGYSFRWI